MNSPETKIPVIDAIPYWIDTRVITTGFKDEKTPAKDTVPVDVDAVLFWKVIAAFRRDTGTQSLGFLVACNFDTRAPRHVAIELLPLLGKDGAVQCDE